MTRLLGPDPNTRSTWRLIAGAFRTAAGGIAVVYADVQGSILADIRYYDPGQPTVPQGAVAGSTLTVDYRSEFPLFWFPDGTDVLWVSVDGGPLTEIHANYDARLDALTTQVDGIVGGGLVTSVASLTGAVSVAGLNAAGVETTAGATAKAAAAQAAATSAAATDATAKANAAQAAGAASAIAVSAQRGANLADLASAATARTNLGLGAAATLGVGTAAGTVAAGDDARIVSAAPSTRSISTTAPLTGGGDLSANRTLAVAGATTGAVGVIQLAGDLAGTAAAPTVPGLAAKADDSAVVHKTGAETVAGVKTFSSPPVVPTAVSGTDAANKTYADGIGTTAATDATAKANAAQAAAIAASAQRGSNLSDLASVATARTNLGVPPSTRSIATTAPLSGGGDLSADRTLTVAGATTGAAGVVQLAGDLAGTSTSPTVTSTAAYRLSTATTREVLANDPLYGTPGTRAAFINALNAAEALGKHSIVRLPPGFVVDVGNGLSLSGYSVQLRGAGASTRSSTAGSTIKATTQTGPVLDFSGWVTPGNFLGRVTHEGFMVIGSGVADATKNNVGIRVDTCDSTTFRDIAIQLTGGAGLDLSSSVIGNACYLCDFERIIIKEPVGANTNDVAYLHGVSPNGNRFRGLGLRSLNGFPIGASGAIVLVSDGTNPAEMNYFDACWSEGLRIPNGGTIWSLQTFNNIIIGTQFWDTGKVAGATGTSYVRMYNSPGNSGGNRWIGLTPGANRGGTDPDMGIELFGSGNIIDASKGDGSNQVVVQSGSGYNSVRLSGKNGGVFGTGIVDNSGVTTNHLIDEPNATEVRPANWRITGWLPKTVTFPYTTGLAVFQAVPAAATTVVIDVAAGGGGAGSGRRGANGTARGGGGSGGGGGVTRFVLQTADLTTGLYITVGAGGAGAAAVTTDDTNGTAGAAGGASTVRDSTQTITYASTSGGTAGGGGTTAGGGAGGGGLGLFAGANGGAGQTGNGSNGSVGPGGGGGGGGGGLSAADAAGTGGVGGYSTSSGPFAFTTVGAVGASRAPATVAAGGSGGGGGSATLNAAGMDGGNGGNYGAGGGGGSASSNTFASGKGGNGANGFVTLTFT